jgi:hypothetical protein
LLVSCDHAIYLQSQANCSIFFLPTIATFDLLSTLLDHDVILAAFLFKVCVVKFILRLPVPDELGELEVEVMTYGINDQES